MDLHYLRLSPTGTPMLVYPNSAYAALHSLNVVKLALILGISNLGIAESLSTGSMSTVDLA
jgi:hypothetical protein